MSSKKSTLAALAAAAVLVSPTLFAQAKKPVAKAAHASATALPSIKYETFTLPNGLKVITHVDHRLPLVAVDLWYHVGPLNERPGRTGFAHLFEHMMFEGSEHVGEKQHIKIVDEAGATDVNGTTAWDRTNYFETMPSNQLELALWLESDRMGFLMEGLNRTLLANQRDVVRNERRQGEGQPYDLGEEQLMHMLFPKDHPYYGNVIGSHADVEAARIADVREFHQQFYTPNNATLAIAGDFDMVKLKALLTKYFGPIPKGPAVPPVNVQTPPITAQKRATVTDTVQLPMISIGWLTPAAFTKDSYSLAVAIDALGGAKVSRLDKALVYDKQLAQRVTCGDDAEKLVGFTNCSVVARPGVKLEDIEPIIWDVIKKFDAEGPTEAEVTAAKAKALSSKIFGLQRLGGFGGVADTLNRYNQYTGDPNYLPKDVAAMNAVTVASAKAAADQYLTPDHAVVVLTVPGKKVVDDVPRSPENTDADVKLTNPYTPEFETAQEWRKSKPVATAPVKFNLPVPKVFTLANGLTVMVAEEHTLPIVSVSLAARAGTGATTVDKAGLPQLAMQTLTEATASLNVEQLSAAEERTGSTINAGITMDGSNVSTTFLKNHTNEMMPLFADVVLHPAFSQADFDRLKKRALVGIQQSSDNVMVMAQRVGPHLLYGDTAYGMPSNGTPTSVTKLTADELPKWYTTHIGPSNAALVITGDVTLEEAKKLAEQYLGGWNNKPSAGTVLATQPNVKPTYVALIDKPGAPQTGLMAFGPGLPVSSPDMPKVEVMNFILGGSFGSRINMNLREQHGYTYGASSGFRAYADGGTFLAGGLIRTDATAPATTEMMGEIKRFADSNVTDAELKGAKDARIQSLPGQFETTGATAAALRGIFLFKLPVTYYAELPEKYRAVTADDVKAVAAKDLHPDQLVIVTAGDRSKIEQSLKDAKLGDVVVVDMMGQPVVEKKK
ncbi:M16 family metallopeptidase [Granulicella cerasi]|uniref:M16 family metallopeptidase n=1 Tax=Granulicella cerasi TaxID=741063 RepID=A0ABW1ZA22_9BACT|nr:pitrilysin family protein [Granulicella cerasi]